MAVQEAELLAWVIAEAQRFGWLHYHPYDSRLSEPGFPDLVLVKHRVIYRELKISTLPSAVTINQRHWLHRLRSAGQDADVWTLDDWPVHIIGELRSRNGSRPEPRPLPPAPTARQLYEAKAATIRRARRGRPRNRG